MKSSLPLLLLCLACGTSQAANPLAVLPSRPSLTLDAARALVAAAERQATALASPGVVAVVDTSGMPLLLERMDGATPASAELAVAKARSSAMFRVPTAALEKRINDGRYAAATAGYTMMSGGEPIVVDGQVVGAIGVSTVTSANDAPIATAAIAALK